MMKRTTLALAILILSHPFAPRPAAAQTAYRAALTQTEGKVLVKLAGKTGWVKAREGMGLVPGDALRVGEGARAEITVDDGSVAYLQENTEGEVQNLIQSPGSGKTQLHVGRGVLLANVQKLKGGKFMIHTPVAVATIRGTELGVESLENKAEIAVFDGWVIVKDFVTERGLPTDGTDLLIQFLHEVSVRANQVTTVIGEKGIQKPGKLTDVWEARKAELASRRERVQELRTNLQKAPEEELNRTRADARTKAEQSPPEE